MFNTKPIEGQGELSYLWSIGQAKDNGNYDNFVKNIKLFKEIGINLINLFDDRINNIIYEIIL